MTKLFQLSRDRESSFRASQMPFVPSGNNTTVMMITAVEDATDSATIVLRVLLCSESFAEVSETHEQFSGS